MTNLTTAYIGLGSNLGDRLGYIKKALEMLAAIENIKVNRTSDIVETSPLGRADQPAYLNAVTEIKTSLSADDLYKVIVQIEASLGRMRDAKWSPRIIDLDILLFGRQAITSSDLTIPHPQMHLRSFVLKGLCQLNAQLQHPVIKESMSELITRLADTDFVPNSALPQLVSVAGIIGVGKTTLAKKLSELLKADAIFEAYDTNPFLPDVYAGKKELALDSQLYFLTTRLAQLNPDVLKQRQIYISDYIFAKELIYANHLLDSFQLELYKKIFSPLSAKIAQPVLVIYLQDYVPKCLERVHKRNRPYEQRIEQKFLETLIAGYDQLFSNWKICPVIRLPMLKFDYMQDKNIEHLADQIKSYVAV